MNGVNRKNSCLVAMAMMACVQAAAFEISWYQQEEPGHADGLVRLDGLGSGDLVVATPGRKLETAIKRLGEAAVVSLSGNGHVETVTGELVVVATQGPSRVRAAFPLVIPVPIEPAPHEVSAAPPAGQEVATGLAVPETEEPPAAPPGGQPVATSLPANATAPPAEPAPEVSVASASPEPPKPVCPRLVITPGSLYATSARLVAECGHELGEWHPGDADTIVDFEVREPRAVENDAGIDGLFSLLREYGLVGLIHPVTGAVDIHEL